MLRDRVWMASIGGTSHSQRKTHHARDPLRVVRPRGLHLVAHAMASKPSGFPELNYLHIFQGSTRLTLFSVVRASPAFSNSNGKAARARNPTVVTHRCGDTSKRSIYTQMRSNVLLRGVERPSVGWISCESIHDPTKTKIRGKGASAAHAMHNSSQRSDHLLLVSYV